MKRLETSAIRALCLLVRGYQLFLSPLLVALGGPGGGCRFSPSCSVYFTGALKAHGLSRGLFLGFRRIARCHPFGGCGHDPVPAPSPRGACGGHPIS